MILNGPALRMECNFRASACGMGLERNPYGVKMRNAQCAREVGTQLDFEHVQHVCFAMPWDIRRLGLLSPDISRCLDV